MSILTVGFGLRNGFDWQIVIYLIYLALIILGSWAIPLSFFFIRKKIIKISIIFVYLILFISYFYTYSLLPSVKKQYDIDTCLDIGICSEGLEINTEYGRIKINKENCVKYGWKWDETRKWCNTRN